MGREREERERVGTPLESQVVRGARGSILDRRRKRLIDAVSTHTLPFPGAFQGHLAHLQVPTCHPLAAPKCPSLLKVPHPFSPLKPWPPPGPTHLGVALSLPLSGALLSLRGLGHSCE